MDLKPKTRYVIYLISVFINVTIAAMASTVTLPFWLVAVLGGFNAVVNLLAKNNVTLDK